MRIMIIYRLSDFYKPLLNSASRDGKWLTVPFAPTPIVVFYNKEWFDQANVAYPDPNWTWEDFSDIGSTASGVVVHN